MSKEFEEVVLKKLEKLDNTEKLIQEVILYHKKFYIIKKY